jgi:biopolymer transport protein ExbB
MKYFGEVLTMKNFIAMVTFLIGLLPLLTQAAWDPSWTYHQKIKIDTTGITQSSSDVPVVIRLHSGNFDFLTANIDGADIRFVTADDKTELDYFIEKFDAVNELAIIWVKLPNIDPAVKDATFSLYAGNESATSKSNAKAFFGTNAIADFEFPDKALLTDSISELAISGEVVAQTAGLIGGAATTNGSPLTLPAIPEAFISSTTGFTWSAWIKPSALPQQASLFKNSDAINLTIVDTTLSLTVNGNTVTGGTLTPATWQHVAFTVLGNTANLFLNGTQVATTEITAIELPIEAVIADGFTGDIDALEMSKVARDANWLSLVPKAQGMDSSLVQVQTAEAGEEVEEEHAGYLGILINSLTIDAKIVIGILALMFAISIWVMWNKFSLVTKTDKGNQGFLEMFKNASATELLNLDKKGDFEHSNLFMLYQAGLREIKKRVSSDGSLKLSGASMDAIKAAIDAELVRETQRQNAGIVLLTIAISGGPFLGLLGTVVGVMITFAAIAAAGDVNVNAIAPGIAAALLATVAGLAVAIPALFAYNYLASRIKNITIAMQIFVDEFITRTAELYGKE